MQNGFVKIKIESLIIDAFFGTLKISVKMLMGIMFVLHLVFKPFKG